MAGKQQKRFRAANFSSEEMNILVDLVEDHKDILENKRTDATAWKEKDEEWEALCEKFNARTLGGRTPKELRAKYVGLKKDSRKKAATETQSRRATGGGPFLKPSGNEEDKVLDRVHDLIALSADGLETRFGSDVMELPNPREPSADEEELIGFVEDMGDGVVVAAEDLEIEWKAPEITAANFPKWGHYNPKMLRTPKSAALARKPSSSEAEPALHSEPVSGAKPSFSPDGNPQSRRRPVLRPKKMAAISGSTTKFATLAEVKTELARVQLEATLARNAHAERREEELHALNVQIKEQELRRITILVQQEEEKLKKMRDS